MTCYLRHIASESGSTVTGQFLMGLISIAISKTSSVTNTKYMFLLFINTHKEFAVIAIDKASDNVAFFVIAFSLLSL